jgi:hypothetical protein
VQDEINARKAEAEYERKKWEEEEAKRRKEIAQTERQEKYDKAYDDNYPQAEKYIIQSVNNASLGILTKRESNETIRLFPKGKEVKMFTPENIKSLVYNGKQYLESGDPRDEYSEAIGRWEEELERYTRSRQAKFAKAGMFDKFKHYTGIEQMDIMVLHR